MGVSLVVLGWVVLRCGVGAFWRDRARWEEFRLLGVSLSAVALIGLASAKPWHFMVVSPFLAVLPGLAVLWSRRCLSARVSRGLVVVYALALAGGFLASWAPRAYSAAANWGSRNMAHVEAGLKGADSQGGQRVRRLSADPAGAARGLAIRRRQLHFEKGPGTPAAIEIRVSRAFGRDEEHRRNSDCRLRPHRNAPLPPVAVSPPQDQRRGAADGDLDLPKEGLLAFLGSRRRRRRRPFLGGHACGAGSAWPSACLTIT